MAGSARFQYLGLVGACAAVTAPLEAFLGARVWRQPARLCSALAPTVAVFGAWDLVAIARQHWSFNPRTTTGWELPGHLPVEEMAFFVVIPTCAILTLEAVRRALSP
ncbi:MAG: lycopene cyclase domain-containing protein [Acidimicrobiales bacterium]